MRRSAEKAVEPGRHEPTDTTDTEERSSGRACCHRAEHSDLRAVHCGSCHTATCAVHAYIGSSGDWHCHGCFDRLPRPLPAQRIALSGQVAVPANSSTHVVVVLHGLHICGAARHCLETLVLLNGIGAHTSVVAPFGGGQWADRFLGLANDVTILTDISTAGEEIRKFAWRGERRIISAHYDKAISWVLSQATNAEIYAHFHTEPEAGEETRRLIESARQRCRSIFFPSHTTADSYKGLFAIPPPWWEDKMKVIKNAFPATLGSPPKRSVFPRWPADEVRLGIVSRLDDDKISIDLLVETLHNLYRRHANLKVRIAGWGMIAEEVVAAVRGNGFEDAVNFLGWVDDIQSVYDWCDVTFLPSYTETMPYAVMESVLAGRPVAVPRLGYFADVALPKVLVRTFDPGSGTDAARAIDEALLGRLGVLGDVYRMFDRHSWEESVLTAYGLKRGEVS